MLVAAFSMKLACLAPRDNASRPNAPVPANASRTIAPCKRKPVAAGLPFANTLKSAPRARSEVGRISFPSGVRSFLPRHLPAITRTAAFPLISLTELFSERLARHFINRVAFQVA